MSSRNWVCWLKGHFWHFYNGTIEPTSTPLYYTCGLLYGAAGSTDMAVIDQERCREAFDEAK